MRLLLLCACCLHACCAWFLDFHLLLQGDPGDAVQEYGRWCGAPRCGMTDCCQGAPCPACVVDADALAVTAGPECLRECPPVDEVDALCMRHDFCVSAQLHRYNGSFGNCSYSAAAGLTVPANECVCDRALYHGVRALGGLDGFKSNLLTWLTSSWGHCLETDKEHRPGACVPFRVAVSPGVYDTEGVRVHGLTATRMPGQRLSAALGAATGFALPLVVWFTLRQPMRRG